MTSLKKNCCKKKTAAEKNSLPQDQTYTVEEVEAIDQPLFEKLQTEKQARFNWRRIMTMI